MPPQFTARQCIALQKLESSGEKYLTLGELPRGIGQGVMDQLSQRGLAELGTSERFIVGRVGGSRWRE